MGNFLGKIDKTIFWFSAVICLIFVGWTLASPASVTNAFSAMFNFFTTNFSWAFLISVAFFVAFCFGLAFSKYGQIKLGKDDEKPEYSTLSWFAMLFAAGMGVGLVFWGVAEPITFFATPPFGEPNSPEAAGVALRYAFFHWGLHPWAIYAIVGMSLAYFQFRKGLPGLISSTFYPVLGEEGIRGPIGKAIDTLAVIVTLFGVATSLGLGTMQVNTGLNLLFGIPNSNLVSILIIAVVTVLFTISAVSGIDRGIKMLSNTNMVLAFALMAFILLVGPSLYILKIFSETVGQYINNIVWMSFFTDTQGDVAAHTGYDWVGGWTVFYWAWWITWAPFVGSFIARISRGRTIKEFVMGILVAPTLLSFIWFSIMGGTALNIELFGAGGISEAAATDVTTAIFAAFSHLPMGQILSLLAMAIVMIFFITSADSATYVVGMMTSGGDLNPKTGLRVVWGAAEGAIAAMLLLAGGLSAVQTVALAIGFPFMVLMLFMMYSFMKGLKEESILTVPSTAKITSKQSPEISG